MGSAAGRGSRRRLVFTSVITPGGSSEKGAVLLAESIRAFAGGLSGSPIWFYVPGNGDDVSSEAEDRLLALDVELVPYKMDKEGAKFFFVPQAVAAAKAEERAEGEAAIMAWMLPNTLVLREPRDLLLPGGKSLGYRPVHHANVGSRIKAPLDAFWGLVYARCGVTEDRVFPMKTHVDGETLRPYINAGLLAARPERRLIRDWRDLFLRLHRGADFEEQYRRDERYKIFVHQALLSGLVLSGFSRDELLELPPTYNYPMHLYDEDATGRRPCSLEELVTLRHEGFYDDPNWGEKMPAREPLKRWIADRLLR
jgi:hypothetical protein